MKKLTLLFLATVFLGTFLSCNKEETQTIEKEINLVSEGQTIENLSKTYFQNKPDEAIHEEKVVELTTAFYNGIGAKDFTGKKVCRIQPIYAYGVEGVAYYEIWFTENNREVQGWLLVGMTDKDYPIVNFSTEKPYSRDLVAQEVQGTKIYRFGQGYFALDKDGAKIADYGRMPTSISNAQAAARGYGESEKGIEGEEITLRAGQDYFEIDSYETLKELYGKNYFSNSRKQEAEKMNRSLKQRASARVNFQYAQADGRRAFYTEVPVSSSYNYTNCLSGLNNSAWGHLFYWWDENRGKDGLIGRTPNGEENPRYNNTSDRRAWVDTGLMSLRSRSGTYCVNGYGLNSNSTLDDNRTYLRDRGYTYVYYIYRCNSAGCTNRIASTITENIKNRSQPVLVKISNTFTYYGFEWAQEVGNENNTWVYVQPGTVGNNNDNVWIRWTDLLAAMRISVYG